MSHHHSETDPIVLGKINTELIAKLKPYYGAHPDSLLVHAIHKIRSFSEPAYHGYVDTSHFNSVDFNIVSKKEQLKRTVFALKKIKEFNHHFFNDNELRIINPVPAGVLSHSMKWAFAGFDSALLTAMWISWSFSKRNLALVGGLFASQMILMRVPNYYNEILQNRRRKNLARKYIDAYGAEFFHEIVNPSFDLEKLAHLENKLHQNHHEQH